MPTNAAAFAPARPCSQGSVPAFAINVSNAQDVLAGFEFSKTHGVPLVIRNTGHDYKGRSSGPGTLALWVYSLTSITHSTEFVPTGCAESSNIPTQNAVTIGAGVTYNDLVDFADTRNLIIPTGGDVTVGAAGGYSQGGGHGILSNVFGLAADRAIEFEVVTPRGDHVFATQCQNTDLFFALRGGGGGTFGVVLSMTTKVFNAIPINAAIATFDASVPGQALEVLKFAADHALQWAQQGWGYYVFPAGGVVLGNTILSASAANESLASLRAFVATNLTGGAGSSFTLTVETSYKTFFNDFIFAIHVPDGVPLTAASRLIPAENFATANQRAELADAVNTASGLVDIAVVFATTPFLHGNAKQTSVNPAWYSSLWHVAIGNTWNFNTTAEQIVTKYASLSAAADPLRRLAPTSGAYVNEADVYEPNWQESFWGANYVRLLLIKQKYDPEHLLDCWQCVGWLGQEDARYSCYADLPI